MKSLDEIKPILIKIIEGLGKEFGPKCEFVIHDYSKGFNSTVIGIVNGQVTGRAVGSSGTEIGLKLIQGTQTEDGKYNYITRTQDGRYLRSTTIYLKDENEHVIGSLCVNLDITSLLGMKNFIEGMIDIDDKDRDKENITVYKNVEDMLVSMINDSIRFIGVPVSAMSREQKISGIGYLKKRGAFLIKNSVNTVAKYYNVSKFTIYNYLNENEVVNK